MTSDEQERLHELLALGITQTKNVSKNSVGFGLGLFISNKIAEQLSRRRRDNGGGIHFKSKVDKD